MKALKKYVNLATEYRPQTFEEVVGQDLAVSVLKKIAQSPGIACRSILLQGSYGSGKCISVDSYISTENGYVPGSTLVENLDEGFTQAVIGVEQTDGGFCNTTHLYRKHNVPCKVIKTKFGKPIKATFIHPILVFDSLDLQFKFKEARNITTDDYILKRKFRRFDLELDPVLYRKLFLYGYYLCRGVNHKGTMSTSYPLKEEEWIKSIEDKSEKVLSMFLVSWEKSVIKSFISDGDFSKSVLSSKDRALAFLLGILYANTDRISTNGVKLKFKNKNVFEGVCNVLDYLSIIYSVDKNHISIPSSHSFLRMNEMFSKVMCVMRITQFESIKRFVNTFLFSSTCHESTCVETSAKNRRRYMNILKEKYPNKCSCIGSCYDCCGKEVERSTYGCYFTKDFSKTACKFSFNRIGNYLEFCKSRGYDIDWFSLLTEKLNQENISLFKDYLPSKVLEVSEETCEVFDVTIPETRLFMSGNSVMHNTTLSRIFAKAMNCEKFKELGDVCNECVSCKDVSKKNSNLYYEFDSSVIGNVEGIQAVKEILQIPPVGRRVMVFDEAHSVSKQAMTQLLKVLEEGVTDTLFVFATTEDMMPTIESRSIKVNITTIPEQGIISRCKKVADLRGIDITETQLSLIAKKSHGHMRNALSILQYFEMCGDKALDTSFQYVRSFLMKCLSPSKHSEALTDLDHILEYPIVDVRDAINAFIRSIYISEPPSVEDVLLKKGLGDKLFGYFYSPIASEALKSEAGIEILLRAFYEKTTPKQS